MRKIALENPLFKSIHPDFNFVDAHLHVIEITAKILPRFLH
jgi:hypothetical protein